MRIHESLLNRLPIDDIDNCYVVADFDRTITNGNSETSWSIISMCNGIPESYIYERKKLYDIYRPIELDEDMNFDERSRLVSEWYRKIIELFIKYKISDKVFEETANDLGIIKFRDGALEFLTFLYDMNIPLIIISAGIGNFIESFLKNNNCLFDNIYISSNKILFKNGVAYSIGNNLIHSLNKNEISLPNNVTKKLIGREKVLLLGDQLSDLNMVDDKLHDEVIRIGFYSTSAQVPIEYYYDKFDIVCDNEADNYHVLKKVLFKKRY